MEEEFWGQESATGQMVMRIVTGAILWLEWLMWELIWVHRTWELILITTYHTLRLLDRQADKKTSRPLQTISYITNSQRGWAYNALRLLSNWVSHLDCLSEKNNPWLKVGCSLDQQAEELFWIITLILQFVQFGSMYMECICFLMPTRLFTQLTVYVDIYKLAVTKFSGQNKLQVIANIIKYNHVNSHCT